MSTKQTNDTKVQALLKVVEGKKEEVKRLSKKPSWRTNCAFTFDDKTGMSMKMLNLNTANKEEAIIQALSWLIQKESAYSQAREELGLDEKEFQWNGFLVSDWREDFKSRLERITIEDKKKELETLDKKLSKLLSEEARTKNELEEIENLLK
jgi:hypothetical protein